MFSLVVLHVPINSSVLALPKTFIFNIEHFHHKRPFYPTQVEQLAISTKNISLNGLGQGSG
jgi:hypothetical protein